MAEATHEEVHRHPAPTGFIRKYIFSIDHKVIGIQYILLALSAVLVGMIMSVLMRVNLSWPGTHIKIMETLFPRTCSSSFGESFIRSVVLSASWSRIWPLTMRPGLSITRSRGPTG